MDLNTYGFDAWFAGRAAAMGLEERDVARVTAADRGLYRVVGQAGEGVARLAGRLAHLAHDGTELPCVGDFVALGRQDGAGVIQAVLPRKTFLRRRSPGTTAGQQMIAANIDLAFLVQSCRYDFNPRRLSRYLVMAADGGASPAVLLTKIDLLDPGELAVRLAVLEDTARAPVLAVSAVSGEGLPDLAGLLAPGLTCCLLGSSGVGKTTLVNRLLGREAFAVRETSGTGEGVHTTTRRQMVRLAGGALLVDTPGMRELGLLDVADGLEEGFDEIAALAGQCRFADCRHEGEPGCAVRAALERGILDAGRFGDYRKLKKEAAFSAMTLREKRQRDKAFGRMVKSVKKGLRG